MPLLSIFSSKRRGAAVFLLAAAVIFVSIAASFELVLARLNDTVPYERVLEIQKKEDILYSQRYDNTEMGYKVLGAQLNRAEILALGMSTILGWRQSHFPGLKFYNAGVNAGQIAGFDDMREILAALPDGARPRVVLLGLGPWMFNPAYPPNVPSVGYKRLFEKLSADHSRLARVRKAYARIVERFHSYQVLVQDKRNWAKFLIPETGFKGIGLDARMFGAGYAPDGSFHNPEEYETRKADTYDAAQWKTRLANDHFSMVPADVLDENAVARLLHLLAYCRGRNIRVIGILLPLRNDLYAAFERSPRSRAFYNEYRRRVSAELRQAGASSFDFTDPETLGLGCDDFVDWLHMKTRGFDALTRAVRTALFADLDFPRPVPGERRVVFIGDSLTENWDLKKSFSGLDLQPVNRGIEGQTSRQLLERFRRDVVALRPKAVVILAGTNDVQRGIPATATEAHLEEMTRLANAAGIEAFLGTLPPIGTLAASRRPIQRSVNSWIESYCASARCRVIDFHAALSGRNFADGVHPDAAGYTAMTLAAKRVLNRP